jgi:hypothetical protein
MKDKPTVLQESFPKLIHFKIRAEPHEVSLVDLEGVENLQTNELDSLGLGKVHQNPNGLMRCLSGLHFDGSKPTRSAEHHT